MKKFNILGIILLSFILIISGCGNNSKKIGKPNDETPVLDTSTAGGSIEDGDGYGFTTFDLEIEIDGNDVVEAEFDATMANNEPKYKNKLEDVKFEGTQAMNKLDALFMYIRITKDTPKQEVVDKILKYLGIETYSKFDLEVDFDEGTFLDIEFTP